MGNAICICKGNKKKASEKQNTNDYKKKEIIQKENLSPKTLLKVFKDETKKNPKVDLTSNSEDLIENEIKEPTFSSTNNLKATKQITLNSKDCKGSEKKTYAFKDTKKIDIPKTFQSNPTNHITSSDKSKMRNIYYSKSSRKTVIDEFIKNPDAKTLSAYLNRAFTNNPSLAHINFIILTLHQLSENASFTWKQFERLLSPCFEYIQEWKKNDKTFEFYQKVLLEMLPIIDHAYKEKGGSDFPILSELIKETPNYLPTLKNLPVDQQLKNKNLHDLFESIVHRVNFELKKIENKGDSLHLNYLKEFSTLLSIMNQRDNILKSLRRCRFDKREFSLFLSHSIILGADSGIYALLNTLSESEEILFLKDSHINPDMIDSIMKGKGKMVIGEGSFGKIRMAIAILPNKKSETSLIGGKIICVKKAGSKKKPKDMQDIWDSTWNDYCSIDFLEDAPEIFDMKITKDCRKKPQGYCFQELLMLPNGDIFKIKEEYQKWFHVKHYFIGIFKLMIKLHERGICMTDLKPANTLYDKRTQTTKVVDLAGAVRNENLVSCKIKHVKEITYQYCEPELLEKIEKKDKECMIDLTKSISCTIGIMMKEISSKIKEFKEPIVEKKIQKIHDEVKNLINELNLNASNRISLEEGLQKLTVINIPDLDNKIVKTFESYIDLLKRNFTCEDHKIREVLNLKNDIFTLNKCFNDKLKVTERNPDESSYDPSTDKSIGDLLPTLKEMIQIRFDKNANLKKEAVILFGSAGSGKSTLLQKLFIEAIQTWRNGDPIPIFMNLAIHYDLKDYWRYLKESLDLNDLQFEDLIKQPILLFLDSLDESRMDLRVISNISNSLWSYANENSVKMMITCRSGYLEDNETNRLNENIKLTLRYIIPLNYFFFDTTSNLEELVSLYLNLWENRKTSEIKELVSIYLEKIKEFRLQEIMKTTCMVFMILAIMPKLIKIDSTSAKNNINFLAVYELYLEKNLENEIYRSTDEAIKKKSVAWFFKIGILLAESMMLTEKATNLLGEKETIKFLMHPLLAEIGENYNKNHHLTGNFNIYNILRTLNLNIHFEKRPSHEEITLSFPHDLIKNYFLTKGFEQRLLSGEGFPEWVSRRLVVDDQNLVRFMVEAIKGPSFSKLSSTCELAILSTKHSEDPKIITRAANLITFLVASNYSFYGKNLSDIKIRGANISDGIFHACNFDRADLSNVTLNNIKMDRASFRNTNFKDVILDIYPYFEGHMNWVTSVVFSPDGKKVASGSWDQTVRLWDAESGKELTKCEGHSGYVNSVAFSPDGKKVASGSYDCTVKLWDIKSEKELKTYKGHIHSVNSVSFSPDGKQVVSGSDDRTVRVWDVESGEELKKYEGHSDSVSSVAFSPDGMKVMSGSDDKTIRLWDLESGKDIKKFMGHIHTVSSIAFSKNGKQVVSGSGDDTIRLWDVESGKELKKYEGHSGFVNSVAISPDGKKVVSGSWDNTVRLWDLESKIELKKYEGHSGSVRSVAFSPDGKKVVSGSWDNTVRFWDVESGKELKKYEGNIRSVSSVAFSLDGKQVVSGSDDKTVRLWDLESGKELKKYEGHSGYVHSVAFSPDGKKVVSGSWDKTIRLWEIESGKELKKYEGHSRSISSVAFSPDGKKVVSGSGDDTARLWNLESANELKKYEGHIRSVSSVAFSPDGKRLASGSDDNTVRVWDVESGKEFKKYEGHSNYVTSVAFSPDGKKVVSGSYDKTVRLWDVESGKELKKYEGHSRSVSSVALSPVGKEVVSGSDDNTIRLWDLESGKELKKYEGHSDSVNSVAFSPDGKNLVSGSADKTIRLWDVASENKNNIFIISSSATAFSSLNCQNYEDSLNCSTRLMSLFKQNHHDI